MDVSARGLSLIEDFEGCRLTAYQDAVGVWTIGFGHTGADVTPGLTITQVQANTFLAQDVAQFAADVHMLVRITLTQGQFDALVSFAYNVGLGALRQSALLELLNQGSIQSAARQFAEWVHAGDVILLGLVRRRAAEIVVFLT